MAIIVYRLAIPRAWGTRTVLIAFRTDNAGRLIVGSVRALRGPGMAIHSNWARRRIRALFPTGEVELEHEWYGRIGMTNDHLPRLQLPAESMIALTGFNGRASRRARSSVASSPAISARAAAERDVPARVAGAECPFRAIREGY